VTEAQGVEGRSWDWLRRRVRSRLHICRLHIQVERQASPCMRKEGCHGQLGSMIPQYSYDRSKTYLTAKGVGFATGAVVILTDIV
jgi:hypothetical protein